MKRQLIEVCRNVNGLEFDKIFKLCKELFPRRKHEAYSLKPDEQGIRRYVLKYNLSPIEYLTLCTIYEKLTLDERKENSL